MKSKIIICVDDEKIITDTLCGQLISPNIIIEPTESAQEALELLEELYDDEKEVYAIISDWLMPGMKGDELLIKVNSLYPEIKLVLLSGQADPEALARLSKYDCTILKKPWIKSELLKTLRYER